MIRRVLHESRKNDLDTVILNFKKFKKARTGESKLTFDEIRKIREAVKTADRRGEILKESSKSYLIGEGVTALNDLHQAKLNLQRYKKAKLGESQLTYSEFKQLKETVDKANRLGIKLREADANFNAQPQAQQANGAQAQVNPEIQQQIQSLLSQVESLAAAAGVQINDLGADPTSGTPPVDGQQPQTADAAAMGNQMMEAVNDVRRKNGGKCNEASFIEIKKNFGKNLTESVSALQDRIALRQAKLDVMNESYDGDFASAYMKHINEAKGGKETTESPITTVPSAAQLAAGYASGPAQKPAKRWPTKEINDAPLQGAGTKQTAKGEVKGKDFAKVKESDECGKEDDKKKVEESIVDKYVDNYYAPKLDFSKIKEAMNKGILG